MQLPMLLAAKNSSSYMVCTVIINKNLLLVVLHLNNHRVSSCQPKDQNYKFDKIIARKRHTSQQRSQ